MSEILIVLAIAVIVIGPKQLPQLARNLGKMLAQFKRATNDLRHSIGEEVEQHLPMDDLRDFKDSFSTGLRDLERRGRALVEEPLEEEQRAAALDITPPSNIPTPKASSPSQKRLSKPKVGKSGKTSLATKRSKLTKLQGGSSSAAGGTAPKRSRTGTSGGKSPARTSKPRNKETSAT